MFVQKKKWPAGGSYLWTVSPNPLTMSPPRFRTYPQGI